MRHLQHRSVYYREYGDDVGTGVKMNVKVEILMNALNGTFLFNLTLFEQESQ